MKHLSSRAAFIQFAQPREGYVGKRKKGKPPAKLPSFFVDVRTLAGVLLSGGFSLEQLCDALKVATPKKKTDEHGSLLSDQYIEYAVTDVQATWECYVKLKAKLKEHDLSNVTSHDLISEASLGKSYLEEMGIKPWRQVQPEGGVEDARRERDGDCVVEGGEAEVDEDAPHDHAREADHSAEVAQ